MFYNKELEALRQNKLIRVRNIFSNSYLDFASNDYLGLSFNKKLFTKAATLAAKKYLNAPRASMLVNGYSKLHYLLEKKLIKINKFENCILFGSGFLANIALFESLCRKNDLLFVDEDYHASGILGTKLIKDRVIFFSHNNPNDLKNKIKNIDSKGRILIAIEGIYSMNGNIAKYDFYKIAMENNAILIVDDAHSNGTLGNNLLGYFDYYKIKNSSNLIKMGTFSKAYGSYGAYVLSSKHIGDYLQNRAKPLIYSTALGIFDTALALINLKYIRKNKEKIKKKIEIAKKIIFKELKHKLDSQIFVIHFKNQNDMINKAELLKKHNFLVGAIRKPTVKLPILRIILSTKHKKKDIVKLCNLLKK